MPKNHARKKELAYLKEMFGVRHHDAVAILDDPRRDELCQVGLPTECCDLRFCCAS
ncbi:hypothetical protein [Streptomyces sp. NPDC058252]|uniref:hypothetical protein n=1 Tax=Streptomyces sp. NPDC058252 TaxID=3346405 RepID=UPI0036E5D60B